MKPVISFTEKQNGIVTAGITVLCATLVTGFIGLILWSVYSVLSSVSVVIVPLLVALILTLILKPYYLWLHQRLKKSNFLALLALFLSILIPLSAIFAFFGKLFISQIISLLEYLPILFDKVSATMTDATPELQAFLAKYGLEEKWPVFADSQALIAALTESVSINQVGGKAISYGVGAIRYVVSLIGWFVVPIYLIYFLIAKPFSGANAENFLPFLKPSTRQDVSYLIDEFFAIIVSFFRGQLTVAFIQGFLFGIGFWIVGLPYGFLIGLTLGCFNLVPYLGNVIGLAVALPMAFFGDGGSLIRLGLVLLVFGIVQFLDGYFITPKIQGKRTGLNDATIIFSLLFWGVVFKGILGVLLAIPLSAFIVVLWRLLKTKYIKELI